MDCIQTFFPLTEMLSYEMQKEAELTLEPISIHANLHGSTPVHWNMAPQCGSNQLQMVLYFFSTPYEVG